MSDPATEFLREMAGDSEIPHVYVNGELRRRSTRPLIIELRDGRLFLNREEWPEPLENARVMIYSHRLDEEPPVELEQWLALVEARKRNGE